MTSSETDDWSLTEIVARDSNASRFFRKNLAPRIHPGDASYPFLAFVTFRYRSRDEGGLPERHERDALESLDDSEAHGLEADQVAVHVAAVLGGGVKDLIFYVRDLGTFAERIGPILQKHARFTPSCQCSYDPTWNQYDDFP